MYRTNRFGFAVALVSIVCSARLFAGEAAGRKMQYSSRSETEATAWQKELRGKLFRILKLEDLVAGKDQIALEPEVISSQRKDGYLLREMTINSTAGRRISIVLTVPADSPGPFPAVVCMHGHRGSRHLVYDEDSIYRGFAAALAEKGYVTIATDVGQHEVYEAGRTLMGERLWDLIRCVDFLQSLAQVDRSKIGCAGLSLGGEMAMWLGAMDERVSPVVSSGFLTVMDQMEENHCMCWKFDGLRELVDYADIYSLIAPRPLMCQNGLKERPTHFTVPIARKAMQEVKLIYADLKRPDRAVLQVHEEGHVIDLPSLLAFFDRWL